MTFITPPKVVAKCSELIERLQDLHLSKTDDDTSARWRDRLIDSLKPTPDDLLIEVTVEIRTGRRHQIRSCFAYLGYPLFGDTQYYPLQGFDCQPHHIVEARES